MEAQGGHRVRRVARVGEIVGTRRRRERFDAFSVAMVRCAGGKGGGFLKSEMVTVEGCCPTQPWRDIDNARGPFGIGPDLCRTRKRRVPSNGPSNGSDGTRCDRPLPERATNSQKAQRNGAERHALVVQNTWSI